MIHRKQYFILYLLFLIHSYLSLCVPSSTQCGCSHVKPIFSESRIVGGYTAQSHSWPWIVSLRRSKTSESSISSGSLFCGGTLINSKYVLTAAHCFQTIKSSQLSNYFIVIGAQYKNDTNPIRITIKSVILHDEFNGDTYENDIALLELTNNVYFNDSNIGFICLPDNNMSTYPYESMNGTVIGWGRLQQDGLSSYTLQQVELPIISYTNKYCRNVVNDNIIQFCAGFIEGGKDTCQGDSGGPLMIHDSISDTWNIAGITSYGYGCAIAEYPGVYTRF
ncbi:unnamed protein product [Rotaria sp. Silwood2]|nr:unnamed protein product [Rotaria sp. Silwood2]CAF4394611.1 unnamed protein product [Rotaria sp. Silwood2]